MAKLAVATAAGGEPTWGYMKSILGLRGPGDGGFGFITAEGLGVEQARNLLVERFLKTPADWLLMVDRDAVLHPQTALRLMSWNEPIVAALAFTRNTPPMPTVFAEPSPYDVAHGSQIVGYRVQWEETRTWVAAHVELHEDGAAMMDDRPDDALVRVDFTGMHCTLIRRDVLEGLCPGPWFERVHPIGGPRGAGEDYYFCRKAAEAGYATYVDRSVQAGHLAGERSIGGLAFLAWGALANSASGGYEIETTTYGG
jgi:hypothetical protein